MVGRHAHGALTRAPAPARSAVDRVSRADLMQFVTGGSGVSGHVGAVLLLDTGPGFSAEEARRLLGERIRAVPRLRQRMRRAPPGCGRPFWADDPAFDPAAHIRQLRCPPPGDERALLDVAAARLAERLPADRPLWSAVFVTGLADGAAPAGGSVLVGGGTALVMVMNHVLADGVAGLTVLGKLLDQATEPLPWRAGTFPARPPRPSELATDAWTERLHRLVRPKAVLRGIQQGVTELGGARPPARLPPTSLNQPAGPRRRLDVVTADLAAVRELGRACGGTVNDVVLAAVAGALRELLAARGEDLGQVTVSVPVAARQAADVGQLGNQIGVMPVQVPADGDLTTRIGRTAVLTSERKSRVRGASAALFVPAFLLMARTGLLTWYINRQRRINTFVTNLRGPERPLRFAGAPVRAVIPVPATNGNVPVTFAVLSYAGTLWLTVLSDPDAMPDAPLLAAALRRELGGVRASPVQGP